MHLTGYKVDKTTTHLNANAHTPVTIPTFRLRNAQKLVPIMPTNTCTAPAQQPHLRFPCRLYTCTRAPLAECAPYHGESAALR